MNYEINGIDYKVNIIKKNNKNTYLRVKEDKEIYITTHYLTSKNSIIKLLEDNKNTLEKMLNKSVKHDLDNSVLYVLGLKYDIIIMPIIKNVEIQNDKIYVSSMKQLNKYLEVKAKSIFQNKYDEIYKMIEEQVPYYKLRIRKMKTRWGVCNRGSKTITLNLNLIHYDIECLEYVIVHELIHLIHFNHSASFWNLVEKYSKDYKRIRKKLKE
jgi:predicted metal-dependent hydrolase